MLHLKTSRKSLDVQPCFLLTFCLQSFLIVNDLKHLIGCLFCLSGLSSFPHGHSQCVQPLFCALHQTQHGQGESSHISHCKCNLYFTHIIHYNNICFGSVDPKQVGPRCRSQSVAVLWHVGDGEDSQSRIPCPTHF